jgi:nicotinamidase-related amidase
MSKTALFLLDLQQGILGRFKDDAAEYLSRVSETISAARAAGIHIIYVKTCFRPGHPEISSRNFSASRIASFGGFVEGDQSVDISPPVSHLSNAIFW